MVEYAGHEHDELYGRDKKHVEVGEQGRDGRHQHADAGAQEQFRHDDDW